MRLHILSSVALSFLFSISAGSDVPLDCAFEAGEHDEACQKPLQDVTAVTPGSSYVVKLPCLDCPISKKEDASDRRYKAHEKNDLAFNVSLSHDRRTVLLNDKPIFPSLSTNPFPNIYVGQVSPNFSRADLDNNIGCGRDYDPTRCSAFLEPYSVISLDFDYSAKQSERPEARIAWDITFDAIGGHAYFKDDPTWMFNRTDQKMLNIVVQGTRIDTDEVYNEVSNGGSTLFDTPDAEPELKYRLDIVDVMLVMRSYTFPPSPRTGSFGQKIRYFFGVDDREKDGHHIYIKDDWDWYAKKGTLKNVLGKIWYEWPWELVFFIIFGTLGTIVAVFAIVKLITIVVQQRKLARWQGMDEVWARMRREPQDEEEDGLLNGEERYTDNTSTPRLTNEYMRAKPLPSKPLPDKPLPDIPLIDDL